jgi:hypothetical protein
MQLEIIEMQCSTNLKQLFLNSTKLNFYRALQNFQNNCSRPENFGDVCVVLCVRTNFFDHEIAEKLNQKPID